MLSDPICALATPAGRSALAVIRLSGRGAIDIARRILRWDHDHSIHPRVANLATIYEADGTPIDRGLVSFFFGPESYTGDDLVEFSSHGGLLVPAQILAAMQAAGARAALPGEFTRRAVLNGKLDLVQAEGVIDLIDATSRAQGRGALRQLEGGLSRRLADLRSSLIDLLSLLSYDIDFPEEDSGTIDRETISAQLARVREQVDSLVATAPLGERLREGALVVLAGRPNAGKSSLFNALLGSERALVTEIPGTTRDTIEAFTDIDGWPIRLADTAGLRDSDDRIERLGIEVSRRYLGAADLVILCVEAGRELEVDEMVVVEQYPSLIVRTKVDLLSADGELGVSVVTGRGIDRLRSTLVDRLFGELETYADLEPLLTRERHRLALERAGRALDDAAPELDATGEAVLAAHHLRRAVAALDELIGVVDIEEILGRVFERFCVGK
jgi:tRNA modification GTPase